MEKKKLKLPEVPAFIDILGTPWKIEIADIGKDPYFEKVGADGYCAFPSNRICILDIRQQEECEDFTQEEIDNIFKRILRHEIVHAFLSSSGLASSSFTYRSSWAKNEEMVDWIAIQGCKIYKAWQDANCLDIMSPERYMEWKAVESK